MSIFDKIGGAFKDGWKDAKNAFKGDNNKDPFSRVGQLLSPEWMIGNNLGIPNLPNEFADLNNRVLSDVIGTDNNNGSGVGGWVGNKPASTIGALITGGYLAGGAMGGPATGAPMGGAPTPASGAAPTAAGSPQPMWQQMLQRYGRMQQMTGQQGQQAQQPLPTAAPTAMGQVAPTTPNNTNPYTRTRQTAQMLPTTTQFTTNFGGGY